mmetsp:Transcript_22255/g.46680  ORF Transcript_22255/g.46680 Transcript_22255/m.46680 type:complete len:551 (+) Transcript_22255:860-2512(+)
MPVACHLHVLVSVQAQAHGPLEVEGRHRARAVEEDRPRFLPAKTTAEPLRFAHHLVLWHAQHVGNRPLVLGRRLGRGVGQHLIPFERHDGAGVRLEVKMVLRSDLHVALHDVCAGAACKALVHVAPLHLGLPVLPVEAVALDRILDGHDRGQVLVLHADLPGRLPRLLLRLSDDDADDLPDASHLVLGEALLVRDDGPDVVAPSHLLVPVVAHHALDREGLLRVDGLNQRMRLGGEHQGRVQRVGEEGHVIHVLGLPRHLQPGRGVGDGLAHDVLALLVVVQLQPKALRPGIRLRRGNFLSVHGWDVLLVREVRLRVLGQLQGRADEELEEEGGHEGPPELHHAAGGVRRDENLLLERLQAGQEGLPVPLPAGQELLRLWRHHRLRGHSAVRKGNVLNDPLAALARKLHAHAGAHDRNVILPPVSLLEFLHVFVPSGAGQIHFVQDLAVLQVHLPVAQEEVLRPDFAHLGWVLAHDLEDGARAHPNRIQVTDGTAGHDVPCNGRHVLDLVPGKPLELVDDGLEPGRLEALGELGAAVPAAMNVNVEELGH